MNRPSSFDNQLTAWLDEGPIAGPSELLVSAQARARSTRQRPTWWLVLRGKTMDTTLRAAPTVSTRAMLLLLGVLMTVALVATAAFVGSRLNADPQRNLNGLSLTIPHGKDALLAFATYTADQQSGDVFVVRADGTDSRRLTNDAQFDTSPTWSPDGSHLAFYSGLTDRLQVRVADPDGTVRILSDLPGCMDGTNAPAWSPDGKWVLFQVAPAATDPSCEPTAMDLYVVSVDGGDAHRLLATSQTIHTSSPDWTGNRIVMRGVQNGSAQLLVATVTDPARPWDLTAKRIDSGYPAAEAFGGSRWSPDGTEVATTYINVGAGFGTAMVIPGDGGSATAVLKDPTKDQVVPAWSPDGSWLTVLELTRQLADHGTYHLVRVDRDGSNARVIQSGDLSGNGGPAYVSPDGSLVAARAAIAETAIPNAIEILDLVGSAPAVSIPAEAWSEVSWQPLANPDNPAANAPAGAPQF